MCYLLGNHEVRFVLIDAYTHQQITDPRTEVSVIQENDSATHLSVDPSGLFEMNVSSFKCRIVAKAPYYITDTFEFTSYSHHHEGTIALQPDECAILIKAITLSNVVDRTVKINQLTALIDENALICRVDQRSAQQPVDVMNKSEFLLKLAQADSGMTDLNILEARRVKGKVAEIRFTSSSFNR